MNKAELLSLANKGKVEISGIPLEVIVRPSAGGGEPWIEIHVDPLSPLHQPLILGNKWVEYVTDEECEELPGMLEKYKREAAEFCEKAKTVVKAEFNSNGTYSFTDCPEKVQEEFKDYPSFMKRWFKDKHHIIYIGDEQEYWYAPGKFTLELNGVKYEPHWSYWLNSVYYVTDEQIKKIGGIE